MESDCDLCLQKLSYQPIEKIFKKDEAQNTNLLLKTKIFKSHNRVKVTTKSDGLSFNNSRYEESKIANNFHDTVKGTIIPRCYLQDFKSSFSLHLKAKTSLPYKRTP